MYYFSMRMQYEYSCCKRRQWAVESRKEVTSVTAAQTDSCAFYYFEMTLPQL